MMTDWQRVVLRACCGTLEDSLALGRKIPNITSAGVRLMLAGYTAAEIEYFKSIAEQEHARIMERDCVLNDLIHTLETQGVTA